MRTLAGVTGDELYEPRHYHLRCIYGRLVSPKAKKPLVDPSSAYPWIYTHHGRLGNPFLSISCALLRPQATHSFREARLSLRYPKWSTPNTRAFQMGSLILHLRRSVCVERVVLHGAARLPLHPSIDTSCLICRRIWLTYSRFPGVTFLSFLYARQPPGCTLIFGFYP